jgi:hypothetical protein
MAKSSKSTEYAVKYLNETVKMTAEDIAKELGTSVENVNTIITSSNEQKNKSITSKDLMIRQTRDKGLNTVSVMTQAASAYNDEALKNATTQPTKDPNYIFRPNG